MRAVWMVALALPGFAHGQVPVPQQLSVSEAVGYAMANSPALRAAEAGVAVARADTGAARARTLPRLSANGFASEGNMPSVLQSAMGVEPQALALAPDRRFADANLMLMAPLYTGGLLSGLVRAAVAMEQAAVAEVADARAEAALRVREAYALAQLGVEMVKAQQARVTAAEAMVANAQAQEAAGKGIEASVRRAEAELAEAQRELTHVETQRRKAVLDLLAEMGAPLEREPALSEPLVFRPAEGTLESHLDAASRTRGELLAARQRARAVEGRVASRAGALGPQVYGFAMGDAFSPRDPMGRNSGYTVGLTLSFPVFDGGERRSEAAAAKAELDKARAEVDRLELQTAKEVRQAWLDVETFAHHYHLAKVSLTAAQSAYETTAIRVQAGKGILVEQLDALAALTRARANLAEAAADHQVAVARLDRAVGYPVVPKGQGGSQ